MKTSIQTQLFELQDKKYGAFVAKLTPTVAPEKFIGVRTPILRKLAKQIISEPETEAFIQKLPHDYYEENMLHGLLLSEFKDFDVCIEAVNTFLPYVDNWAVCDSMSPKVFKKHREELLVSIKKWMKSPKVYTCRFGTEMLMSHFLDIDFKPEYLELPARIQSDEYYINMMTAWYYATALAKQWDSTISYLENEKLVLWVHNKTIQKAVESYRITDEQKAYLKTLKRR